MGKNLRFWGPQAFWETFYSRGPDALFSPEIPFFPGAKIKKIPLNFPRLETEAPRGPFRGSRVPIAPEGFPQNSFLKTLEGAPDGFGFKGPGFHQPEKPRPGKKTVINQNSPRSAPLAFLPWDVGGAQKKRGGKGFFFFARLEPGTWPSEKNHFQKPGKKAFFSGGIWVGGGVFFFFRRIFKTGQG